MTHNSKNLIVKTQTKTNALTEFYYKVCVIRIDFILLVSPGRKIKLIYEEFGRSVDLRITKKIFYKMNEQ